jgi:hypothetical protein
MGGYCPILAHYTPRKKRPQEKTSHFKIYVRYAKHFSDPCKMPLARASAAYRAQVTRECFSGENKAAKKFPPRGHFAPQRLFFRV